MKNKIIYTFALVLTVSLIGCNSSENQIDSKKEDKVITSETKPESQADNQNNLPNDSESEDVIKNIENVITEPIQNDNTTEIVNEINGSSTTEEITSKAEEIQLNNTNKIITINDVTDVIKVTTPNHSEWNSILSSNVSSSGKVNYSGMKNNISKINAYIKQLENLTDQKDWSRNEKLAYWINLYNAATVRLIVQNYPTTTIKNINGGKPWDKKVVTIGSKSYSLNQIENDVIRPKFKEPRIHFAVNCAAVSCPKIMNSAFMPDKLNKQLTKQAKAFINGSKNNITADKVVISKIFEWYAGDFGSSIIDYLNKYSTTKINSDATISYNNYNWDLNK